MTGDEINQDDLAAESLDDFPADHLVMRIVSALDQDHGFDACNKFFRRVFVEHDDEIDGFKCGKHLGACLYRLHGTIGAFQAANRGVTVQADDETITRGTRAGQQFDMPRVQQIEATVGKPDA